MNHPHHNLSYRVGAMSNMAHLLADSMQDKVCNIEQLDVDRIAGLGAALNLMKEELESIGEELDGLAMKDAKA